MPDETIPANRWSEFFDSFSRQHRGWLITLEVLSEEVGAQKEVVDEALQEIAVDHPRARQQVMNIAMDEPVDYGVLGQYLARTRGVPRVPVRTPYHSTWLDNTKAKFLLGWRPQYDMAKLVEEAWSYRRSPEDPRHVWYPG